MLPGVVCVAAVVLPRGCVVERDELREEQRCPPQAFSLEKPVEPMSSVVVVPILDPDSQSDPPAGAGFYITIWQDPASALNWRRRLSSKVADGEC